jgi:hypothetical protein
MELSMESNIDKLAHDFYHNKTPRCSYPLGERALNLKLRAKDDVALAELMQRYQFLIGKLLYPASQLRVDVAFAISHLARMMSKPNERLSLAQTCQLSTTNTNPSSPLPYIAARCSAHAPKPGIVSLLEVARMQAHGTKDERVHLIKLRKQWVEALKIPF